VWLVPAAGLGSLIGSASIWEAAFLVPIESRTVAVWQKLLY